jgi:hypothetical protein
MLLECQEGIFELQILCVNDINTMLVSNCNKFSEISFQSSKRKGSSRKQAKYWCQAGLDQEGFGKKFISSFIGKLLQ